jgi:hypothetical protein
MTLSNKSGNPMAATEAGQLKAKLSATELEKAEAMLSSLIKTLP